MIDYLKDRFRIVLLGSIFLVLACLLFMLYQIPLEVVLYLHILYLLWLLLIFPFDFLYYQKRKHHLEIVQKHFEVMEDLQLPQKRGYERAYKAVIESITDFFARRDQTYQQWQQQQKEYNTLWIHQIKLPIAAMKLQLETEVNPDAQKLKSELMRIDQYANMVLAYSRLHSGSTDYLFEKYDIDLLIKKALRHFSSEFIAKKLSLDFKPTHLELITDEKWLTFVFEQLLSNALKYTTKGTISIYSPGSMCLVIEDTGSGIAKSDLPRLCELGYTGLNGHQQRQSSGIGLYLCKEILTRLSCQLTIESQENVGTRVILRFEQKSLRVE